MTDSVLPDQKFWSYIDSSLPADEDQEERLLSTLNTSTCAEKKVFATSFVQKQEDAYRWDVWGTAYLYGGGCSDDGFMDFRAGLISLGETKYRALLDRPDDLADVLENLPDNFDLFRERFGQMYLWIYEGCGELGRLEIQENRHPLSAHGEGNDWDFDDDAEMRARYPKMSSRTLEAL